MKRIELTPIDGLVFEPVNHTYHLNGKELQGITPALHNRLAPDEFIGISEKVLNNATERGKRVHASIQNFIDNFEDDGSVELKDFIDLTLSYKLNIEKSEVLVTDFENYASAIDLIARESEDTFSIGDIKTFGVMSPDRLLKLQFQLSIYAMFAEKCWEGIHIDKLFCVHIRNVEKADGTVDHIKELIYVKRIDPEICRSLLQAELDGDEWINPLSEIPEDIQEQEDRIRELLILKQQCEEELKERKEMIMERMESMNIKSWTFMSGLKATRKLGTVRQSFDLAKFKKAYPELPYDSYMKQSLVNGSLVLTV